MRIGVNPKQSMEQSIVIGAGEVNAKVEEVLLKMRVGDAWEVKVSNPVLQR